MANFLQNIYGLIMFVIANMAFYSNNILQLFYFFLFKLKIISLKRYRSWVGNIIKFFSCMGLKIMRTKFIFTGDRMDPKENAIILSNHTAPAGFLKT
jgi:1-acyl-sn-glycerol-3-phosphate acyltransferase